MTDLILQLEAIDPGLSAVVGTFLGAVIGVPLALIIIWWMTL